MALPILPVLRAVGSRVVAGARAGGRLAGRAAGATRRALFGTKAKTAMGLTVAPARKGALAHAAGAVNSAIDRAWQVQAAFGLMGSMLEKLAGWTVPAFAGEITVSVQGGPHADIRRVWYLALATAFGRLRNTFGLGNKDGNFVTHEMAGLWDITTKTCQVQIVYATSIVDNAFFGSDEEGLDGTTAVVIDGVRLVGGVNPTKRPGNYIKRGPEQLTVGGTWPDWLRRSNPANLGVEVWAGAACVPAGLAPRVTTVSALPRNFRDIFREYPVLNGVGWFGAYPVTIIKPPTAGTLGTSTLIPLGTDGEFALPDASRVITTAEKNNPRVQPPGPILDGRGRSNLLSLVAQSLQTPCFAPTGVPCSVVPNGDPGVFVAPRNTYLGPVNLAGRMPGRSLAASDVLPGVSDEGVRPTSAAAPNFQR